MMGLGGGSGLATRLLIQRLEDDREVQRPGSRGTAEPGPALGNEPTT